MDGDRGVAAIELAAAPGDKKDRSDFTTVPAALSERWNLPRPQSMDLLPLTAARAAIGSKWNLPRPKKHAPGMFFASLCSAGLFDSVGIVK